MDTQIAREWSEQYLIGNYRRAPVGFVDGQGIRLRDLDGKVYLDFLAGIAVNALGYGHPRLVRAIQEQAARVLHVSNLYLIPEQAALARMLVAHSALDQVFFCNSGAEANEAAIKLARKAVRRLRGEDRFEIITASNSFHGRTLAALAATRQPKYWEGFGPLPAGFTEVPFNDLDAVGAAVTPHTCAIMIEPVQGEGGVIPATAEYMRGLRVMADRYGLLLIFDEIQTGIGRTGKLFAYEHYGVEPDIMTLAKALGGGVPIGAVLAKKTVAQFFQPGDHGSTFGGNPLACAAGLAVMETVLEEDLSGRAARVGAYLMQKLEEMARRRPVITGVRGIGLLVGVELATEAAPIVTRCRERGLLINPVKPTSLRLAPPLVVTEADVDAALAILESVLAEVPVEAKR